MTKSKLGTAAIAAFALALMTAPGLVSAQTSAPATTAVPPVGGTMGDEMMSKGMGRGMGEMKMDPAMQPDAASPPMAKKGCCMKMNGMKGGMAAKPAHKPRSRSAMKPSTPMATPPAGMPMKDE